jgi:predicted branched-subunit amino acid permease
VESYVDLPIMPLKLILKNPRAGLIIGNSIGAIISNAVTFNIPLYFQAVLLESATSSGLRLIVPSIAASTVGTATGFLITWSKRLKPPLVAGVILLLIGTVALSCMQRGMPDWLYLVFLVPQSMGTGFMFPATFMSVLAVSDQAEQAVVTSTLILWRSMGMVLGVATSSLVLQNALFYYLRELVTGPDRDKVRQHSNNLHFSGTNKRIGNQRSPQIRQSDPTPRTRVPRASHRFLRLFIARYVHNGCYSICGYDLPYASVEVA